MVSTFPSAPRLLPGFSLNPALHSPAYRHALSTSLHLLFPGPERVVSSPHQTNRRGALTFIHQPSAWMSPPLRRTPESPPASTHSPLYSHGHLALPVTFRYPALGRKLHLTGPGLVTHHCAPSPSSISDTWCRGHKQMKETTKANRKTHRFSGAGRCLPGLHRITLPGRAF